MTPQQFRNEIVLYCQQHGCEENVIKYARFFKEGYKGYGLSTPQAKELVKIMSKNKEVTLPLVLEAMPLLMQSGMYEEVSVPIMVMDAFAKQFSPATLQAISTWFDKGIYNWAHADILGMMVLPKFLIKGHVTMEAFAPWIVSPHKFQRRCVPVTLIKILKTAPSYPALFAFLEPLMLDPEREVHQGMGWFLREAWKRQPLETEAFLLKWKESTPRLIIQYACEKMSADEKIRFKRTVKKGS